MDAAFFNAFGARILGIDSRCSLFGCYELAPGQPVFKIEACHASSADYWIGSAAPSDTFYRFVGLHNLFIDYSLYWNPMFER